MKVLMNKKVGGAWGFITESLVNALVDKGHDVRRYDGKMSSWEDFDPDIYIGCSGHKEDTPVITRTRKAYHVNPFGPVEIPNINEQQHDIDWVLAQKPDVVFGYGSNQDRIFWSHWTKIAGIPWVPMPTAGDKTLFSDLNLDRQYDVIYLGGRWVYKAKTIDAYLLPALREMKGTYKLRGWGGWPPEFNSSEIADQEVNAFINSGKIGPCMSEEHTHIYGIDIPERAFKLALCGTLVIHDFVPSIKALIPSAVVASDPIEYLDYIEHFIKDDDSRNKLRETQKKEVLNSQTYHHRIATLFTALGYTEEAKLMV